MDNDQDISTCNRDCHCVICDNVYSLMADSIQAAQLKYDINRFHMYTEEYT